MKRIGIFVVMTFFLLVCAQAHVEGVVLDDQGQPLVGANLWWVHTTIGTTTDENGAFETEPVHSTHKLVASYIGYRNDTLEVHEHQPVTFVLVSDRILDEVVIAQRKLGVLRSRVSAIDVQTITGEELCRAACCNLSESFETSASVDVAYADAATGAKQIRLLGLSGTYVQMLTENTPSIRGLAQTYGMEYVPGPWMQAIQVSKGTSSVVNGYEALTGQINVDYLHPHQADPLAIDFFICKDLMAEMSITGGWKVDSIAQTALLVHAKGMFMQEDANGDGFTEIPKGYNLNVLNRWDFHKGLWDSKLLVRGLYDQRIMGQIPQAQALSESPYVIDLRTRRIDGIWKNGFQFDEHLERSLGIIASANYQDQDHRYGHDLWDASQTNAYLNAIYSTLFDDDAIDPNELHRHQLSIGLSANYDRYRETLLRDTTVDLSRQELTTGVFAEYTYNYTDKLTLLAGLREDYSSTYGLFTTPRLNIRYTPFPWWTLRGSVGLGYRSACLIADNAGYLASNRQWIVPGQLEQEKSLNTGGTMTFYIPMGNQEMSMTAEYYYTRFLGGVITDIDRDPSRVWIYNMADIENAQRFAHNWQIEANMEVLPGWTWTLAFRYTDPKTTSYNSVNKAFEVRQQPLQNLYKGIISTSYQTPGKTWQFDVTAQFNGQGRMPDGFVIPEGSKQYYTKNGVLYHTWYPQLMAQVTKFFHNCSIAIGSENMTNFVQERPVCGERNVHGFVDPTSASYDASMVWGPISGWDIFFNFNWHL